MFPRRHNLRLLIWMGWGRGLGGGGGGLLRGELSLVPLTIISLIGLESLGGYQINIRNVTFLIQ